MSEHELVDAIEAESRRRRSLPTAGVGYTAIVTAWSSGIATVTIDYYDGGINKHKAFSKTSLTPGSTVLVQQDELDAWWVIGAR